MALKVDWHGVYPAVPTQFHDDLSLDIPNTKKHVQDLLNEGIHGLVMLGTIGENCSLNMEEKMEVLKATVEVAKGKVPILTGVAEYTTQGACETVVAAKEVGVDGIMLLPALVYKSDEREIMAHYRTVATSTDLPIMCYNNRPVYGVAMSPENFKELADVVTHDGQIS
jgi:4-hydroxy-tetrahydrodipicolinate synthase